MFRGTDVPVITCFTREIQSEMTHKVQTRQTCDPASLLPFWHHLILYSFILQGPRCFLGVGLSYFHIRERQRPLLAFLTSFLSTVTFSPDSLKSSGTLSNTLAATINNLEACFQKGNYGLRFVTLNPWRWIGVYIKRMRRVPIARSRLVKSVWFLPNCITDI